MIFIRYEDNGYYFVCYTQGNIICCSTHAIFDKRLFSKCTDSYAREHKLYDKLLDKTSSETELLVPNPSGKDGPAPIPIPHTSISPTPNNLPTHSPSSLLSYKSTSSLLTPGFKKLIVDIEENGDIDTDVEMQPPSPQ